MVYGLSHNVPHFFICGVRQVGNTMDSFVELHHDPLNPAQVLISGLKYMQKSGNGWVVYSVLTE